MCFLCVTDSLLPQLLLVAESVGMFTYIICLNYENICVNTLTLGAGRAAVS